MVLGPPKSQAGQRTIAVPAALMALLSEHMAWRGITGADPDAFVFPAPQGGHLDYANFRRRVWIPATAVAGVEGLAFHDLRRANATGMVLDGIDLKTAQTTLGHSAEADNRGLRAGHHGRGPSCGGAPRDAVHGNPAACPRPGRFLSNRLARATTP
jgi:integrase